MAVGMAALMAYAAIVVIAVPLGWVAGSASAASPQTTVHPASDQARSMMNNLERRIDSIEADEADAGDDAQYFFGVVTIIIGVATLLIAIVAVAATVLGYRLVRRYVEHEFARQVGKSFDERGRPLIEAGMSEMQVQVEGKLAGVDSALADELELFRKATNR